MLLRLLSDRTLREKMGAAGRSFVLDRYEWERTARTMDDLYEKALGSERV
jgi:glycosyltransferase involved in cell wall biosynthesis